MVFLQVLDKPDLEVLDLGVFSDLDILEWFSTCCFKHARIPVGRHFIRNIYNIYHRIILCCALQYLGYSAMASATLPAKGIWLSTLLLGIHLLTLV